MHWGICILYFLSTGLVYLLTCKEELLIVEDVCGHFSVHHIPNNNESLSLFQYKRCSIRWYFYASQPTHWLSQCHAFVYRSLCRFLSRKTVLQYMALMAMHTKHLTQIKYLPCGIFPQHEFNLLYEQPPSSPATQEPVLFSGQGGNVSTDARNSQDYLHQHKTHCNKSYIQAEEL